MARRTHTREALLDAGVELFLEGGYDFVGTTAILARAKAPRGSFYHHFEDKQAFVLAVARHYYEQHLPLLDRILSDSAHPPLGRLRLYFETLASSYEAQQWSGGCLLGLLSQELSDRGAELQQPLAELFGQWRHRLAACLREAREQGAIEADVDCDELAGYLLDGWEGALISMKVNKSGASIERFVRWTFNQVLGAGESAQK